MDSAPDSASGHFYGFLGLHSLLIGLLPFFLPVYLWQHGLALDALALLIGISGWSFVAVLGLWQRLAARIRLKHLISISFALELLLLVAVGLMTTVPGAPLFNSDGAAPGGLPTTATNALWAALLLGIFNGLYNAFFWTTQRALFIQLLGSNDTGRQYGNFQIFVMVILKFGILLGGLLLEKGGFVGLLALSAGISFIGNRALAGHAQGDSFLMTGQDRQQAISLIASLRFRDDHGSRPSFIIDGIFLYLESHFWTLTLFLVVQEDFSRLGLAVVILAVAFSMLFLLIKNRIDTLAAQRVYRVAVWLYLGSWLLRFTLDGQVQGAGLWLTLILITFSSSFFRLAYNKRFFDVARRSGSLPYLLMKSYSSQFWLGLSFCLLAMLLSFMTLSQQSELQYVYLPAALLSLVYLRYTHQD